MNRNDFNKKVLVITSEDENWHKVESNTALSGEVEDGDGLSLKNICVYQCICIVFRKAQKRAKKHKSFHGSSPYISKK